MFWRVIFGHYIVPVWLGLSSILLVLIKSKKQAGKICPLGYVPETNPKPFRVAALRNYGIFIKTGMKATCVEKKRQTARLEVKQWRGAQVAQ